MRIPRAGAVGIVAVALVVVAGLASCAPSTAPRTTPNAIERRALAAASSSTPSNDPVDWVQLWTLNQAGTAIESCVDFHSGGVVKADVGFSPTGDFAYTFTFDLDATEAVAIQRYASSAEATRVIDECRAQTPIDTRVSRLPPTRADGLYSYDRTVLRRCLIEHGQPIDPAPSRSRYLQQLRDGTIWSPYDQVFVQTRAEWYALSDACPSLPSNW
ncbi:MAG: hypothetical protein ABIP33_00640 [Pseudolysinimonas sp.]